MAVAMGGVVGGLMPPMVEHGPVRHQVQEMCFICQCCETRCMAEASVRYRCVHPVADREVREFIGRDGTQRQAIVCMACLGVIAVDRPGWEV